MKKLIAFILAFSFILAITTSAGLTELEQKGDYSITVFGQYNLNETPLFSVTITWTDMQFTYNEVRKWDEQNLSWDTDESNWKCGENNYAEIIIANRSSSGITVEFSFSPNTDLDNNNIGGKFLFDEVPDTFIEKSSIDIPVYNSENTSLNRQYTVRFSPTGTINDKHDSKDRLGTIIITIK